MQKNNNILWKKILFGIVAFVAVFSSEIALVVETSRLISAGLINFLPYILLLVSVVAMINFGVDVIISKKFGSVGSMTVTISLVIVMAVLAFYLGNSLPVFLFMAVFVGRLASLIYDTAVTNLASSFSNVRQAKDFLPLIRGIMDFAFLVAAGFLFLFTGIIHIEPLWLTILGGILMIILIQFIDRNFDAVISAKIENKELSFKERVRVSAEFIFKKSPLFKYMLYFFMPIGMTAVVFVVVYNQIFVIHFTGDELTRYIAGINFLTVLARAIYNLFFYKKSSYHFGLANLIIVYPLVMTAVLGLLMFYPDSLWIASIMYFFYLFSYYSYVTVTTQEVFGLVPKYLNQAVFFVIKGLTPAIFALIGAIISAIVMYVFIGNGLAMIALFFIIMAVALVASIKLKEEYQISLEEGLNDADDFIKAGAIDLIGETVQWEKGEIGLRKIVLDQSQPMNIRQKAIFSLVEIGNPNSIRELLVILKNENNLRLKYYTIQSIYKLLERIKKVDLNMDVTKYMTLEAINEVYEQRLPLPIKLEANRTLSFFGFEVMMDFYKKHFAESNPRIKASIVEIIATSVDRGLISLLEPYLDDEDLHIRAETIIGLWKFPEMRDVLREKMKPIFQDTSEHARLLSLKIISKLGLKKMDDYVLDMVAINNKKISTMAIITALTLGRLPAFRILIRKLIEYGTHGDSEAVEFVFRKIYLLPKWYKKRFIAEIKAQNDDVFNSLKQVFETSDQFFDLDLINLFTN